LIVDYAKRVSNTLLKPNKALSQDSSFFMQ